MMSKTSDIPKNETIIRAHEDAVKSFGMMMPLLLHGCGDVPVHNVNPDTAKLVAALTADYIATLTDAAFGVLLLQSTEASSPLTAPPPRFSKPLNPLPPPSAAPDSSKHKRRRHDDDFWDEPLPEPNIRNQAAAAALSNAAVADWVGLAGCDLNASTRARAAYVSSANALSAQAFLFPICHDAYAYGRVTQIQNSKRSLQPLLTDPATMELVRTEGILKKKKALSASANKKKSKTDNDEDEDDDENDLENSDDDDDDDDGGPIWPGLDALLPSYRAITSKGSGLEPNVESSLF